MNALIDCHTHIHQHNENEHKEIIQRALSANVKIIVSAGTNINDSKKALLISERNENVFAGIGIHPTELKKFEKDDLNNLTKFSNHNKVICISEIGLDFQNDNANKNLQIKAFTSQIGIANKNNLPVIFHIREKNDSFDGWDARKIGIEILKENLTVKAVAHYFQGDWQYAKKILDLGIYISFAKPILRIKELEETVKKIPDDMFVVETDSYPQTFKKNRNKWTEPYHLQQIIKRISQLRRTNIEKIAEFSTKNSIEIFNNHKDQLQKILYN